MYKLRLVLVEHEKEKDLVEIGNLTFADARLAFDVVSNGFRGIEELVREEKEIVVTGPRIRQWGNRDCKTKEII